MEKRFPDYSILPFSIKHSFLLRSPRPNRHYHLLRCSKHNKQPLWTVSYQKIQDQPAHCQGRGASLTYILRDVSAPERGDQRTRIQFVVVSAKTSGSLKSKSVFIPESFSFMEPKNNEDSNKDKKMLLSMSTTAQMEKL